jgi:uncharacterized protein (TIGR02118 family)
MIAAISLMRRRNDVSLARFRRHWVDVHGPLVCRFTGLRRYVQCHVIESPVTTAAARDMRIDGFPVLFFDNDADRTNAHGSPEMAACNTDSQQFIGAVSRVIADAEEVIPLASSRGRISLIALYPDSRGVDPSSIPRVRGLMRYHVREQTAAPNSTIPHLPVMVGGMMHAWFDSLVDLECAVADWSNSKSAQFVVEEHWLV